VEEIRSWQVDLDIGLQRFGDQFDVLFRKGEILPSGPVERVVESADDSFLEIPVYGGEESQRASQSLQGHVLVMLPRDLPQKVPVHIKFWLDTDGILEVAAELDDGRGLYAWIFIGFADGKVVDAIRRADCVLAPQRKGLAMEQLAKMEHPRNRALQSLCEHDHPKALQEAERFASLVAEFSGHR
jgi:hypothetical protein